MPSRRPAPTRCGRGRATAMPDKPGGPGCWTAARNRPEDRLRGIGASGKGIDCGCSTTSWPAPTCRCEAVRDDELRMMFHLRAPRVGSLVAAGADSAVGVGADGTRDRQGRCAQRAAVRPANHQGQEQDSARQLPLRGAAAGVARRAGAACCCRASIRCSPRGIGRPADRRRSATSCATRGCGLSGEMCGLLPHEREGMRWRPLCCFMIRDGLPG